MKKTYKCEKCGVYSKWKNPEIQGLCFKCCFIWKQFLMLTRALGDFGELNRDIELSLDDLKIIKK